MWSLSFLFERSDWFLPKTMLNLLSQSFKNLRKLALLLAFFFAAALFFFLVAFFFLAAAFFLLATAFFFFA